MFGLNDDVNVYVNFGKIECLGTVTIKQYIGLKIFEKVKYNSHSEIFHLLQKTIPYNPLGYGLESFKEEKYRYRWPLNGNEHCSNGNNQCEYCDNSIQKITEVEVIKEIPRNTNYKILKTAVYQIEKEIPDEVYGYKLEQINEMGIEEFDKINPKDMINEEPVVYIKYKGNFNPVTKKCIEDGYITKGSSYLFEIIKPTLKKAFELTKKDDNIIAIVEISIEKNSIYTISKEEFQSILEEAEEAGEEEV